MEQSPLRKHEEAVLTLQELVDVANELLPGYLPKDASGRAAEGVRARLVRFYTTEGLLPEPHKEGREARYVFDHLLALLLVRKLLAEGFSSAAIRKTLQGRRREELQALLNGDVRVQLAPALQAVEAVGGAATARADFLSRVRAKAGLDAQGAQEAAGAVKQEADTPAPAPPAFLRKRGARARESAPDLLRAELIDLAELQSPVLEAHDQSLSEQPAQRASRPGTESTWNRLTVEDGLELSVRDDYHWPATPVAEEQLVQQLRVALLQLEQARRKRRP